MIFLRAVAGFCAMVPGWVWALLLAASMAHGCTMSLQRDKARLNLAEAKAAFADAQVKNAEALARQQAEFRKQEQAWTAAMEGIRNGAKKQLLAAEIDGATAAAAGDRLRVRLSQLAACSSGAAETAAAPGRGASAPSAAGVLADVQRRLDQTAERIARFADASRIAGQACERAFDTLTTTGAPP